MNNLRDLSQRNRTPIFFCSNRHANLLTHVKSKNKQDKCPVLFCCFFIENELFKRNGEKMGSVVKQTSRERFDLESLYSYQSRGIVCFTKVKKSFFFFAFIFGFRVITFKKSFFHGNFQVLGVVKFFESSKILKSINLSTSFDTNMSLLAQSLESTGIFRSFKTNYFQETVFCAEILSSVLVILTVLPNLFFYIIGLIVMNICAHMQNQKITGSTAVYFQPIFSIESKVSTENRKRSRPNLLSFVFPSPHLPLLHTHRSSNIFMLHLEQKKKSFFFILGSTVLSGLSLKIQFCSFRNV